MLPNKRWLIRQAIDKLSFALALIPVLIISLTISGCILGIAARQWAMWEARNVAESFKGVKK